MAERGRRRMAAWSPRRRWLGAAATVLVAAGLTAAVGLGVARIGVEVGSLRVERRDLVETVVATGRVLPPARIEVGTTFLGIVAEVAVEEGGRVEAGQVLVRLDDGELRAAAAAAAASVSQARLAAEAVRLTGSPAAGEALVQADLELDQAERAFDRAEALRASGAVALTELEEARARLDAARSRQRQAALTAHSRSGNEHRSALAALEQARANLAAAEARLARATVAAPATGIILVRSVEPGDVVQPGRVMLVLAREGETRLEVPIDERNLAGLEVGRQAVAAAEAFPSRRFEAVVERIAPVVDPDRGTVEVQLRAPRPPEGLRADMTVTVEIELARRESVLAVPVEALSSAEDGQPRVLVARDGRATAREVRLGVRGEAMAEVVSGLEAGERVIVPGETRVGPGQRVRLRPR